MTDDELAAIKEKMLAAAVASFAADHAADLENAARIQLDQIMYGWSATNVTGKWIDVTTIRETKR